MSSDEKYLREAIELASKSVEMGGGPFGAVIVKDGKVIGRGHNSVTTDCDPTAHAEVNAIRDACKTIDNFSLKGSVLYTSCEPCPMCLTATYWARIDRVIYGNDRVSAASIGFDDQYFYDQVNKDISSRDLVMEQVLAKEAFVSFQKWSDSEDKVEY
jgi:tRNA(Arg) A34 adenosine deaminase TadA